jgi:hypothetical protein
MRNITFGPLDFGVNDFTLEVFAAPVDGPAQSNSINNGQAGRASRIYTILVSHATPDEHMHLSGGLYFNAP